VSSGGLWNLGVVMLGTATSALITENGMNGGYILKIIISSPSIWDIEYISSLFSAMFVYLTMSTSRYMIQIARKSS
jgi:hypothetical protein